ncbi:hypothetical protein ZWY2020_002247 [Hordeum vulgare]|nr:hypothetical protein ZWY2020_002247 [Hordeum vulgare]
MRRRAATCVASWDFEKSPYKTLELERDADNETIKVAYRRLAKFYHPDGLFIYLLCIHKEVLEKVVCSYGSQMAPSPLASSPLLALTSR